MVVDGGVPLFESQAIVQFLDETQPGRRLAPEDARERALDRAWFLYCSEEIFTASWKLESARDAETQSAALAALRTKLELVEDALEGREFLSGGGTTFGLADVGYAPSLYRFAAWKRMTGVDLLEDLPRLSAWSTRVLARPSIAASVPDSWEQDLRNMGKYLGSHLLQLAG